MFQIRPATSLRLESLHDALSQLQSTCQEQQQSFYTAINELISWSYSKRIYLKFEGVDCSEGANRSEVVLAAEDRGLVNFAARYGEFWGIARAALGLRPEFSAVLDSYEFDPFLLLDFGEDGWRIRIPLGAVSVQSFPSDQFWAELAALREQINAEEDRLQIAIKVEGARAQLKKRLRSRRRIPAMAHGVDHEYQPAYGAG